MVQISPIFARPTSPKPAAPRVRLAGASPTVSNVFSRLKGAGSHLLGPVLTGGVAAYDISRGKDPKQVAVETALYEGASTLGAGIGGMVAGPPGAIAGGILAPLAVGVANVAPERLADVSNLSTAEIREVAGAPQFGGLTIPAPYEAPGVPDVASEVLSGISFPTQQTTAAAAETASTQPVRSYTGPATQRPVEESRAPVSRQMPATANPSASEVSRQAVEDEMISRASQKRTDELLRQLTEVGATEGMTEENARQWVSAHSDLAERLLADRASRQQRLAKQFEGFSAYA